MDRRPPAYFSNSLSKSRNEELQGLRNRRIPILWRGGAVDTLVQGAGVTHAAIARTEPERLKLISQQGSLDAHRAVVSHVYRGERAVRVSSGGGYRSASGGRGGFGILRRAGLRSPG